MNKRRRLKITKQTRNRVKRTAWQSLAGGVLTGVLVSIVADDLRALAVALATAIGTVLATWAQNVAEDMSRVKDRRASGD